MVYWFTGQPGSGKTTLALALKARLEAVGRTVIHVDGDDIRALKNNQNYNKNGRARNMEDAMIIALVANKQGMDVVVSLVSPIKSLREEIKSQLKNDFVEIYCHTTKIRKPVEYNVPDYEQPTTNFISLNTDLSLDLCMSLLLRLIDRHIFP